MLVNWNWKLWKGFRNMSTDGIHWDIVLVLTFVFWLIIELIIIIRTYVIKWLTKFADWLDI